MYSNQNWLWLWAIFSLLHRSTPSIVFADLASSRSCSCLHRRSPKRSIVDHDWITWNRYSSLIKKLAIADRWHSSPVMKNHWTYSFNWFFQFESMSCFFPHEEAEKKKCYMLDFVRMRVKLLAICRAHWAKCFMPFREARTIKRPYELILCAWSPCALQISAKTGWCRDPQYCSSWSKSISTLETCPFSSLEPHVELRPLESVHDDLH